MVQWGCTRSDFWRGFCSFFFPPNLLFLCFSLVWGNTGKTVFVFFCCFFAESLQRWNKNGLVFLRHCNNSTNLMKCLRNDACTAISRNIMMQNIMPSTGPSGCGSAGPLGMHRGVRVPFYRFPVGLDRDRLAFGAHHPVTSLSYTRFFPDQCTVISMFISWFLYMICHVQCN